MTKEEAPKAFVRAREEYLAGWGALGSAWGVNRTMSQIHAGSSSLTAPSIRRW